VVIATPGRILDLMEKKVANMDNCKILVLDEVSPNDKLACKQILQLNVLTG
jgi:hypothetical protein